jgi:uncharacterized integral membrane protein
MRLIKSLFGLLLFFIGVVFGALNRQQVQIDFWFRSVEARLGSVLLMALLAGALLGGLVVTVAVVWPLRRRLNKAAPAATTIDGAEMPSESSSP